MRALLLALILTPAASAAEANGERALSASLSALPEACLSRHHAAVSDWGQGRYTAAADALEAMLKECPSPAASLNLGAVRLRAKDFAAAARIFEAAPASARASYLLSRAREGEGGLAAALAASERAVALDPGEPAVALRRAELLTALGRVADAEAELRRALKLSPDNPQALYRLSALLRARGATAEADGLARRYGAAPRARTCRYDDPLDPLESPAAAGPRWIEVEIDALKARGAASVLVEAGAVVARRGVARGRGKIRVPLGAHARVDALRVDWSDGTHSHRAGLDADQKIVVREVDSRVW
jgi:tetratricopeptide (TPR) repeat protein